MVNMSKKLITALIVFAFFIHNSGVSHFSSSRHNRRHALRPPSMSNYLSNPSMLSKVTKASSSGEESMAEETKSKKDSSGLDGENLAFKKILYREAFFRNIAGALFILLVTFFFLTPVTLFIAGVFSFLRVLFVSQSTGFSEAFNYFIRGEGFDFIQYKLKD